MKSPFPGMDPYLEAHWRDVHTALMVYIRDQLQVQLPSDLIARVEEGITVDEEDERRTIYPDVRVIEEESAGLQFETEPAGVAVAEPMHVKIVDEPPAERHVEIIDAHGRIVTVIEVLSPTNKSDIDTRFLYRKKQQEYLRSGVNLVEIDLIRRGEHVLGVNLDEIKTRPIPPYLVCVHRARRPLVSKTYGAPLRERLPKIPIPLRPKDRDVVLDLQELIDTCYERGRYATIDYGRPLDPPLPPEDTAWAEALVREKAVR